MVCKFGVPVRIDFGQGRNFELVLIQQLCLYGVENVQLHTIQRSV